MMRTVKEKGSETWNQENKLPTSTSVGHMIRPTMFMANLDIKTVFDEARPRHNAKIMERHDIHGWLIAALLREMSGLEGKAMFECVESSFNSNRCLLQGSVDAPWLWHMVAAQLLCFGVGEVVTEKHGSLVGLQRKEGASDMQLCVGRQLLDYVPL